MPNVRRTRYYENFDLPKPAQQPQNQERTATNPPENTQPNRSSDNAAAEQMQTRNQPSAIVNENAPEVTAPSGRTEDNPENLEKVSDEFVTPSPTNGKPEPLSDEQSLSNREPKPVPEEPANPNGELVFDVSNDEFSAEDSQGEILVQAVTARGTRPVSEAAVIIYKNRGGANKVVAFNLTNEDGRTENIPVPAPSKTDSQTPTDTLPFADYNIAVRHPMYYTTMIDNVQVFGDELTIQTVELIPLPEFINELDTTKTIVIPKQNL